jgi:lactate dehydrogenase-like 2-hydroxyacid dehydrogenase
MGPALQFTNSPRKSDMSKPLVVLMGGLYAPIQAKLEADYDVRRYFEATTPEAKAAFWSAVAPSCAIVVTNGGRGITAAEMQHLPKLKLVSCFGVGVDAIDLNFAKANGVAVTNTPDVLTEDVADLALCLLLAAVRQVPAGDRFVRQGKWLTGAMPLTPTLQQRKVGIVGMGRIGQAIAKRVLAFNCEVAYHGPRAKDLPFKFHADILELAKWADVIVAALPGGKATEKQISRAALEALGSQGVFVNIARGSVVDQDALVELLANGKLGGAGLDVFNNEPNVPEALQAIEHVVLMPHVGSGTFSTRQAMGQLTLDNVSAHLAGKPLVTPV